MSGHPDTFSNPVWTQDSSELPASVIILVDLEYLSVRLNKHLESNSIGQKSDKSVRVHLAEDRSPIRENRKEFSPKSGSNSIFFQQSHFPDSLYRSLGTK